MFTKKSNNNLLFLRRVCKLQGWTKPPDQWAPPKARRS